MLTLTSVPVGTFPMQPGTHTLRLEIIGKNPQSSDFKAGIDQVVLTAVP